MRRTRLPILPAILLGSLLACGNSPRDQLAKMGISFSVVNLMSAAEAGDLHVVRLFLEAGMTANGTDETRRSVVSAAASGGNPAIVSLLLERGADPNVGDEQTRTPLMQAASGGHAEAARLLLAHGANAQAVRADGMT
ncbi:MAG: ankyrin repeat domain-containing protein, partial [Myxococcales bacterium]|nr:ankyrin repeat domain-containing protein [Myxococcales bacterium]